MIARLREARAVILVAAATIWPVAAYPGTVPMQARHLSPLLGPGGPGEDKDYLFRMVSDQHFWVQSGMRTADDDKKGFASLVKKEPIKYKSDRPFKGVARFGGQDFPFVLDATDLSASGYDLLYVDRNGNGNLTDDGLVKALKPQAGVRSSDGSARRDFPRVLLKLEADGKKYDYSFVTGVYSRGTGSNDANFYVSIDLQAATYRSGTATIDGKPRKVVVLDYNSNGRFNDPWTVRETKGGSDNQIHASYGDVILIDPDSRGATYLGYKASDNPERHYLSTLLNIDDVYYDVTIGPTGDQMTLEPSKAPLGAVQNPNGPYRAVLFGKDGLVKISGQKDRPVPVPAGEWRLLEYQLNLTREAAKLPRSTAKTSGPSPSSAPKLTVLSASATHDVKPVTVEKDKTAALAFGPPYRPAVSVARYRTDDGSARLELEIMGAAGEICTNLLIRGEEPPDPPFTIRSAKGDSISNGTFEWG